MPDTRSLLVSRRLSMAPRHVAVNYRRNPLSLHSTHNCTKISLLSKAIHSRHLSNKAVRRRLLLSKATHYRHLPNKAVQCRSLLSKAVHSCQLLSKAVQCRSTPLHHRDRTLVCRAVAISSYVPLLSTEGHPISRRTQGPTATSASAVSLA